MLVDKPDLVVWRKTAETIHQAKRSLVGLEGLVGFAITQKNSRFDIYDRNGSFVASETRTSAPLTGEKVDEDTTMTESVVKCALKRPYRLAESHTHTGAAVNIQANYMASASLLMAGKGNEEHMAGVSWAATGGGDIVFVDPQNAPMPMLDDFLDNMRQLKDGDIIDWSVYDQEMLRAAESYRQQCFCGWLVEAAKSKLSPEEVLLRMTLLPPKDRHRMVVEALVVLLPHVTYYTGEDKYAAETLDLDGEISLPRCALNFLS